MQGQEQNVLGRTLNNRRSLLFKEERGGGRKRPKIVIHYLFFFFFSNWSKHVLKRGSLHLLFYNIAYVMHMYATLSRDSTCSLSESKRLLFFSIWTIRRKDERNRTIRWAWMVNKHLYDYQIYTLLLFYFFPTLINITCIYLILIVQFSRQYFCSLINWKKRGCLMRRRSICLTQGYVIWIHCSICCTKYSSWCKGIIDILL